MVNRFSAGYLAVECLDKNDEMEQICGLCGVIPEAILGKSLCHINPIHYGLWIFSMGVRGAIIPPTKTLKL